MMPPEKAAGSSGSEDGLVELVAHLQLLIGKMLLLTAEKRPVLPEPARPPEGARPAEAPAHWKFYSEIEEQIVRVTVADRWMTTKEIAQLVGESPDGDIRVVLRILAKRGILEGVQGNGWRLSLSPPG